MKGFRYERKHIDKNYRNWKCDNKAVTPERNIGMAGCFLLSHRTHKQQFSGVTALGSNDKSNVNFYTKKKLSFWDPLCHQCEVIQQRLRVEHQLQYISSSVTSKTEAKLSRRN